MAEIIVTGHHNPDMDSTCASYMYAELKNRLDRDNRYIAVRCGRLRPQVKNFFSSLDITPPLLLKDIYPKVEDIVRISEQPLHEDDSLLLAMNRINELTVSSLPVLDGSGNYRGLISVNEISDFFLFKQAQKRPSYSFNLSNFKSVLSGFFLKRSMYDEMSASIIIGAMPLNDMKRVVEGILPDRPLMVVGQRVDLIEYAIEKQFPVIVITGIESKDDISIDFSGFDGTVFVSPMDSAETTRLLRLSLPVKGIMSSEYPPLDVKEFFDDAKKKLTGSEYRALPVFDGEKFVGTVSRRCFIEKPKRKVIMVDHNEARQSIRGVEFANVVEIIDHHRLGADSTREPIYIASRPVGSSCTIVYQHYKQFGVDPGEDGAKILLAGILSDTVLLKSPTSTDEDWLALNDLAPRAGVDWQQFGQELFKSSTNLLEIDSAEIVASDFKSYDEFNTKIGIGQVEVVTLENLDEIKANLYEALTDIAMKRGLDWSMLLVTNVLQEDSILLTSSYKRGEQYLIYKKIGEGEFFLPGILSRKKQLLPEVLRALEESGSI